MSLLRPLHDGLTDGSLRVAILVGLLSAPVTVALSWEPVADDAIMIGGSISGGALVLAGLIVGYYYHDRPTETKRAGIWTGLAGSTGTILVFGTNSIMSITSISWPWSVVAVLLTLTAVGVGVGFTVFFTTIVAMAIDWVLTRLNRDRRTAESEPRDNKSNWWVVLTVYAVLAPVALGYALGFGPESGDGLVLGGMLMVLLTLLSLPTLIVLFVDATVPRASGWLPNVWLYVGGPIFMGVLVYLFATVRGWEFPPFFGQYAFLAALWLATAVYLLNRRRHRVNGSRYGSTA